MLKRVIITLNLKLKLQLFLKKLLDEEKLNLKIHHLLPMILKKVKDILDPVFELLSWLWKKNQLKEKKRTTEIINLQGSMIQKKVKGILDQKFQLLKSRKYLIDNIRKKMRLHLQEPMILTHPIGILKLKYKQ